MQIDAIPHEQRRRWERGERILLEALLGQGAPADIPSEHLLDLIFNEIALREEKQECPTPAEYAARFPDHAQKIKQLFEAHRALATCGWLSTSPTTLQGATLNNADLGLNSATASWTGRTISHYQIGKRLGAGGMGEVYLAQDLALNRPAAMKFLPTKFSPALRMRLLSEARTSARLQHPNIATFYEAGEPEGVAFIAMEYVAGKTLREVLKNRPMPLNESLRMVTSLLEALGHAHAVGILHRDIKPENIMLTGEGTTKLLDFGIAKQLFHEQPAKLMGKTNIAGHLGQTQFGTLIGTPGYMAPEQICGEPLDPRADLFAVGVVLCEALSGRAPYQSATLHGRLAATLTQAAALPPELPDRLQSVLARALAVNVSDRYASASEFLIALRKAGGEDAVAGPAGGIALFEFENASGSAIDDWIGRGFADSLRKRLAGISGVKVVTRERVEQTRNARKSAGLSLEPCDLGLAMACRWVLSGAYTRSGSALSVTVDMTEAPTRETVWSEQFDGVLDDFFQIQERLTSSMVANLSLRNPQADAPSKPQVKVYAAYVRGQQLGWGMDRERLRGAQACFEEAVALEPAYAPALAGLAGMHAMRFTFTTDPETLSISEGYANRALQADPRCAEAYIWLGYIRAQQGSMLEACLAQRKAMELDPGNPLAPYFLASAMGLMDARLEESRELQRSMGGEGFRGDRRRWFLEESLRWAQRGVELDPMINSYWVSLAMIHLELCHYAEAEWCLQQALTLPGWQGLEGYLGECLRQRSLLNEARQQYLKGLEAVEKSDVAYRDTFRGTFLCGLGKTALKQKELSTADAAFTQALLHLRGRPRAKAGGHILVQALAGLAQAGGSPQHYDEALRVFQERETYNFGWMWFCTEAVSLLELARAAKALGRKEEARNLLEEAIAAGSAEAAKEVIE